MVEQTFGEKDGALNLIRNSRSDSVIPADLLVSIDVLRGYEALASMGRVVTSALMLVLSLGLVRLTLAYYQFSRKAELIERDAGRQLKTAPDKLEAVKSWHDYQVARAGAPLIPSSLWKWMNKDLNEAWLEYRSDLDLITGNTTG
jgi:hypothetical protein